MEPNPKSANTIFTFGIILVVLGLLVFVEINKINDHKEKLQTPLVTFIPTTYNNSIDMEFVKIPAGEFMMGSPSSEKDRFTDEVPFHKVTIKESYYYLGKFEVTQKQWEAVMGDNPSHFKGDDLPVEMVSWNDIQEFIEKLNKMEGTDKYRLPSETEWEYACRAGTTTRYSFGDDESKLGDYACYDKNSGSFLQSHSTHAVGQRKPNPWSLYDMHGNVYEWCQDTWHENYKGAPSDGRVWEDESSSNRVVRGGSWINDDRDCWSARRVRNEPDDRLNHLGFRLLMTL